MPKRYKVLITGSSGMLGSALWKGLKGKYKLYGVDISGTNISKVDITNRRGISEIVGKVKPDIVIHAAAWTDVDGCELDPKKAYRINADGTKNVALACKKYGSSLIYISTDFVFNGKKRSPYKESDRTSPINIYGNSKLRGESELKKILKRYYILRTSWLYGKNGKNFVDTVLNKAAGGALLRVVNDQTGSPTYSVDLAKAIRALIDRVKGFGIYHVSNSGIVSWYEYTKAILKITGIKSEVISIPSEELARPARRPAMSALDNAKFEKFTGYKMRRWNSALKDYLS